MKRGFDGQMNDFKHIGNRVVSMVGRPDTYDPFGTQALRNAVIERWRKRYAAEGAAFLESNQPRNLVSAASKPCSAKSLWPAGSSRARPSS